MNQNIAVLLGAGAIVAAVTGGSCSTNARIDDMNARIDDLVEQAREHRRETRADLQRFDDRLRAVETEFSKVDQRLLTLERVILPAASG